jgi:ATP-dependent RNA helicase DOB1
LRKVAVPAGYNYIPLHETPFPEPEAMAKTYPFTLDPFQRESVRCIERKEVRQRQRI